MQLDGIAAHQGARVLLCYSVVVQWVVHTAQAHGGDPITITLVEPKFQLKLNSNFKMQLGVPQKPSF
jgi:hypothetical protein